MSAPELVPARMLNEFVYCPRLFHLEWVQGEWADNRYTEEGKQVHRRADTPGGEVPDPGDPAPFTARSVPVSAAKLGLTTRVDVIEGDGASVVPVEYKRGRPAPTPERVWRPELIQLAAQALALRENGYHVDEGAVWFAETRERVAVPIDAALEQEVRDQLAALRAAAEADTPPPPLVDSRKCEGCSLSGICLPDEVNFLVRDTGEVRRLHPARDDALPCYVSAQGAKVGISQGVLQVRDKAGGKLEEIRLTQTSQVNVLGPVQVTTQAVQALCREGLPLHYFTTGGWYYGSITGVGHKNIDLRRAQYRKADDAGFCLDLARSLVASKVSNSRTLVRRNHPEPPRRVLDGLAKARRSALEQASLDGLLGVEGTAARLYFSALPAMLKAPGDWNPAFEGRNRRPPTDPVNALLSFVYALLTKDFTLTLSSVGLDPYLGFYHQPRYGRAALALDLMEPFRPLIADSTVLTLINNGEVGEGDFERSTLGVRLSPKARRRVIQAYERRMDHLVTHPVFGYRISYRRVLEVQARLLGRHLVGELDAYPEFTTR